MRIHLRRNGLLPLDFFRLMDTERCACALAACAFASQTHSPHTHAPCSQGRVSCSQLWGGLEWLGLRGLEPADIHELMRFCDRSGSALAQIPSLRTDANAPSPGVGLLSFADFDYALFGNEDGDEAPASAPAAMAEARDRAGELVPKPMPELFEEAKAARAARSQELTVAEVAKIVVGARLARLRVQSVTCQRRCTGAAPRGGGCARDLEHGLVRAAGGRRGRVRVGAQAGHLRLPEQSRAAQRR